jgi:hypothetical protein
MNEVDERDKVGHSVQELKVLLHNFLIDEWKIFKIYSPI